MPETKLIKTGNYIIKFLIIILSFGFIAYRIFYEENLSDLSASFTEIMSGRISTIVLILVFFMMLLNWSVESLKWQYLVRKIERVPFFRSFMAVWAGLTIGAFTPNRTGEYFGRAFILEKANRWEGIFITFTGSLGQLLSTLMFGSVAGFFFLSLLEQGSLGETPLVLNIMFVLSVVTAIFVSVLYFRIELLKKFFQKLIPGKYPLFRSHFDVYSYFSTKELLIAFLLSSIRYMIFTMQFYILIRLCNIDIPAGEGIMIVSCIFLAMSAIPTFALTELGVRGSVSMLLLDMYFQNQSKQIPGLASGTLLACFLIWFINLVIPAITGGFFVFRLKFFRK